VELHLHADGAIRYETALELARLVVNSDLSAHLLGFRSKGINIGFNTVESLKQAVVTREVANLDKVLQSFDVFMPAVM
jgi:hypothetical protein